ncbi:venom allergen 5 [Hyalella azteca]|uniref:Venom allergen 5 n=1 Tax=Hyalella azteca TaxID=294128 RepID=A0A979FVI6_HYAAZ|nr:venom allergen 5 [Hyalella azteca]
MKHSLHCGSSEAAVDPLCAKYGSNHTTCIPAKNCPADANGGPCAVTEADKAFIVKYHNEYRQKISRGQETRGSPGPQPAGTNLRELTWNDDLARTAQRWAEQPVLGHDCQSELVGYSSVTRCSRIPRYDSVGQNLYLSGSSAKITSANWKAAIDSWIDEVKDVVSTDMTSNGGVIGHYTQVVWSETREVGCGVFSSNKKCTWAGWNNMNCVKYICNYGPAGNMYINGIPQPPYSSKKRCKKLSRKYTGLCAE